MDTKYNSEDLVDHQGIGAVIKNEFGEILLQEHTKFGFWTIPIGKVKDGQDAVAGLREELLEECGIMIEDFKELTIKKYFYIRDGKEVKVIGHLFEVLKYSGELKNEEPHKHRQQLFVPLDNIVALPYLSDLTLQYLSYLGHDRPAVLQTNSGE